ncbi:MAG: PTS sugar transporter subunit IIA [Eubacterium aggregans]|uniref:PTS system, N-acetylgalactosamine-specific IIA component n=1 Tax=Eubacterium aggregans TaxID=81409 RepID=A0A1H4CHH3_9FIRM|nr:PTS sugar transporter subunit IIA [Eubacterium aggregans]MDD4691543.1 PTS sugar transporter subunit IIA [Eubacterium aggregans]MEA5074473.1 PTS sugar transporter subunit IIA [Eubacterium aggregans]SEA59512.1 PTS system, N-acetylgalactosamine-specific IIA component [Eubacterium aggregans]
MIGIILATHGRMADGILVSMEMIAGAQQGVATVCFNDGEGTEALKARLEAAVDGLNTDQILILCDLAGGSPYNVSSQISTERSGQNIVVIAGLNLPMLLEAALSRSYLEMNALVSAVLKSAGEGIRQYTVPMAKASVDAEEGI